MYEEFFGFSKDPFHVTADTEFFYPEGPYEDALSRLQYGVEHRKGFILLTGPSGSGKTMLCRVLKDRLEPQTTTALMLQTQVNPKELLEGIMEQFGLTVPEEPTPKQILDRLREFLIEEYQNNKNVCIILDECQQLSPEVLENLRLLSNLETEKEKLLQIVMVGQEELVQKLREEKLRQVDQRIAVRSRLRYLNLGETREYVRHRIKKAGVTESLTIEDRFFHRLHEATEGNPRTINTLCNRSLREAHDRGSLLLNRQYLEVALGERGSSPSPPADVPALRDRFIPDWNRQYHRLWDFVEKRPAWVYGSLAVLLIAGGIGFWSYHTQQDPRNVLGSIRSYIQTWQSAPQERSASASGRNRRAARLRSGVLRSTPENKPRATPRSVNPEQPAPESPVKSTDDTSHDQQTNTESTSEASLKKASFTSEPPPERIATRAPNPLKIEHLRSKSSSSPPPKLGSLVLARYLSYQIAHAENPPVDPSNREIYRIKLEYSLKELVPEYLPGQWIVLRQSPSNLKTYGFPGFLTWEDEQYGRRTVLYFPAENFIWDPYRGHGKAGKQRLREHWNGDARILLRAGFDPSHMFNHKTRGVDVSRLQSLLNEVGDYGITPDGIYGSKTTRSVRDFQQKEGLKPDGIAGKTTNLALLGKFAGGFPWSKYEVETFLDKIQPGGASS